ncbi:MAG: electron transport complex subunit RsxE [Treponema sp.]|nr:electron transport complex subunit RsxE [Treponema sp.]
MSKLPILTKGIAKENPVMVSLLGLCPLLAVSAHVSHALGMGVATAFVLLGVNASIALIRNVIPDKVRIPCFIIVIAGFVTLTTMLVQAYAYSLYLALGIFLPLITVNCVIFSRAEVFARKNTVFDSILDALGMGAGFILAMLAISTVREVIGNGSWLGIPLPVLSEINIPLFSFAPGGFIAFGILLAVINKVSKGKVVSKKEYGCKGCPSAQACGKEGAN